MVTSAEGTASLVDVLAQLVLNLSARTGDDPKAFLDGHYTWQGQRSIDGRLTSTFAARWGTFHYGIDLAGPLGTPEYAAEDGVVLRAGAAHGFGQAIWILHGDGYVTVYGHMEKLLVEAGDYVDAGQTIALMGAEGESTGSHLHFEVHKNSDTYGEQIDPLPWLRARGVDI
jgi:murein DD-endopeptidase MepM/ murein hydrolase activator NlpD